MKVIVTDRKIITPSKEFIGKEVELAESLGLVDYEIMDIENVPDLRTDAETAQQAIAALEAQITPRRLREAVLGDNGWLAAKEAEIAVLRVLI